MTGVLLGINNFILAANTVDFYGRKAMPEIHIGLL